MKQLAHGHYRIGRQDWLGAVNGLVPELRDEPRLGKHGVAGGGLERGLVDERAQVVLIRQAQRAVVFVGPGHGQFQGAAGVEARRPRVGMRRRGRTHSGVEHIGPFGLQELEGVGHAGSQQIVPQLGLFPGSGAIGPFPGARSYRLLPGRPVPPVLWKLPELWTRCPWGPGRATRPQAPWKPQNGFHELPQPPSSLFSFSRTAGVETFPSKRTARADAFLGGRF